MKMTKDEVLYRLVHGGLVGKKELKVADLADHLGIETSTLYNAANPKNYNNKFQDEWILPLSIFNQNDVYIQWMAEQCGGVFVKLPDVCTDKECNAMELGGMVLNTTKEVGELAGHMMKIGENLQKNEGIISYENLIIAIKESDDVVNAATKTNKSLKKLRDDKQYRR